MHMIKLNKLNIFLFFKVLVSYLMILNLTSINVYNSESLLIFILLLLFYYNYDYKDKIIVDTKLKKNCCIFSLFISCLHNLGFLVYKYQYARDISILRYYFSFNNLVNIIGLFFLLYVLLIHFTPKLLKMELCDGKIKWSNTKIFFICFTIIIICWLPYFLVLFPGVLTSDSTDQFSRVVNGFKIVSDHHPVIHTVFIGIIYNIGNLIFNNPLLSTACVSLSQMIIMAIIFSYFIVFLNKKGFSKHFLCLGLIYFSLSPIHGYYSVTMWKDVMFGGFFLLFTINLIEMDNYDSFKLLKLLKFVFLSLIVLFFRNNALYMYILLIPFLLLHYRKNRLSIIVCIILSLSCYFFVKGPIFNKLGISKSSSSEYIAIPLQQIGRMTYKYIEFDDYEQNQINQLIPINVLTNIYNPMTVDSIKFSDYYNKDAFDSKKGDYLKLWLRLVIKHPSIALEAYFNSTLGYWYPNVEFWATADTIYENDMGIYSRPLVGGLMNKYIDFVVSRDIPLLSMQWSIGLCFVLILFSAFLSFLKKQYSKLFYYMPILGIWITMMIATPVFAEFRYVYCAFTCLPLLLSLPFVDNIKKSNFK